MAERDSRGPGAGRSALAARLNDLPATWKLTLAFAVVLSAIAAMGVVLTINLRVVEEASAADNHAHRVAATASSARFALTRQEASLRGYIISGDPFYARRIAEDHRPHFETRMAELERLAAGDPALRGWIGQARSAYDLWNDWAVDRAIELAAAKDTRTIAARMVGPESPADHLIAPAEQALDAIQAQSQRAVEASAARKAEAMRAMGSALALGVVFAAFSAAVMGLALRRSMAHPIVRLTSVMNRLAGGDHSVAIPAVERRDEVGLMAKAVVTFRDAAVQKEILEAEAEVRREETQALALQAQAASHAKSEFLATMAHELRTPLNGVLGLVDIMGRTKLTPSQREHLATIGASGRALVSVVNDVLDISRIEAGSLEILPEPFDMERLTDDLAVLYGALAADKGLAFTLTVDPAARGWRFGDAARLRQIAGNLLSNALKFTQAGEVRVAFALRGEDIILQVTDTGIGVAPHQQAAMFDRFVQADGSSTRRFGGTGLGLAICKELSELMGGTIGFTSELGVGSTFTLQVPMPACAAPAEPQTVAPMDDKLRILVVDDNATNRLVLCALLEQLGLAAECVVNGVEAVAAWEAKAWDAILMDIHMPEMDGVTATSSIRRREVELGRDKTPIIAVTASVQPEETRGYLSAGMCDCVPKPVETRALVSALQGVLAA